MDDYHHVINDAAVKCCVFPARIRASLSFTGNFTDRPFAVKGDGDVTVRQHDLPHDVEAEAKPARAPLAVRATSKRLEQRGGHLRRDRRATVVDAQTDVLTGALDRNAHRLVDRSVRERAGEAELSRGRATRALQPLERALKIGQEQRRGGTDLAETRFALARALSETQRALGRALALATEAREAYARAGKGSAKELAEVDAWLENHERR